jgi:hypothetical protein
MAPMKWFPLLLITTLAACGPQTRAPVDQTRPAQPAAPSPGDPTRVASLAGDWRVAGIDGESFDEPVGLAMTGDDQQLWWEPRCAGVARTYRIDGDRIRFGSTEPPRPAGAPTPPVCAIGLPPRLDDVARALDNAVSVSRTSNNGVLISGPDHSLVLFSQ